MSVLPWADWMDWLEEGLVEVPLSICHVCIGQVREVSHKEATWIPALDAPRMTGHPKLCMELFVHFCFYRGHILHQTVCTRGMALGTAMRIERAHSAFELQGHPGNRLLFQRATPNCHTTLTLRPASPQTRPGPGRPLFEEHPLLCESGGGWASTAKANMTVGRFQCRL